MFPGPVSNASHLIGRSRRRNSRQIPNSTQILQYPSHLRRPEHHPVQHRHQRSPLAARRQVRRPKIAHNGTPQPCRHHCRLPDLPRTPHRSSQVPRRRRSGDTPSAHEPPPTPKPGSPLSRAFRERVGYRATARSLPPNSRAAQSSTPYKSRDRIRIHHSQPPAQPAHLRHTHRLGIHRRQHRLPHRPRVRKRRCPSTFTRGSPSPPAEIRHTATSTPSAEVPLITPATMRPLRGYRDRLLSELSSFQLPLKLRQQVQRFPRCHLVHIHLA